MIDDGKLELLQEMYATWPFFSVTLDMVEMVPRPHSPPPSPRSSPPSRTLFPVALNSHVLLRSDAHVANRLRSSEQETHVALTACNTTRGMRPGMLLCGVYVIKMVWSTMPL